MDRKSIDQNDFFIKSQIESEFRRLVELVNSGIFSAPVLSVYYESVFTEIMIKLNDILQKFNLLNERLSFNDDIVSGDITDLVSTIRNAVCHMESGEHRLESNRSIKATFNIAFGKINLLSTEEETLNSDYQDDVCFFFGSHKIYLNRHIIRSIQESEKKIQIL